MNLKHKTFLAALGSVAFLQCATTVALAYYNPQTGRWLSRDPRGEPGFQALPAASLGVPADSAPQPPGRFLNRDPLFSDADEQTDAQGGNLYAFCNNESVSQFDLLGLLTATGGTPHTSLIRHNNYLVFIIKCPPCKQFYLSGIDYSAVTPGLIKIGYTAAYLASLGALGGPVAGTPEGVNCSGDPVTVKAYMRSRLSYYGKKGAVAAYVAGTVVNYDCQRTCNTPPCCRYGRILVP